MTARVCAALALRRGFVVTIVMCASLWSRPAAAGTLTLTWDANTEPNLAGYILSVGVAPGQYTSTVDVGNTTTYVFTEPDPTLTYYFAVRAYNTSRQMSPYSLEVNSAPAPLPVVTTGAASSVTANGAVLSGSANPMGLSSSGYFEYGATSGYGASTPTVGLGSGMQAVAIANGTLSNLACSSTYHFRAVAMNGSGTAFGNDATLTTSSCALPTVTTGGAISISATGATLTSTVTPNGSSATAAFQYGLTTSYGSTTAGSPVSSSMASVAIAASGLSCGTLYHFRGVATNGSGSAYGADATFTTSACSTPPPPSGVPPTITGPPPDGTISSGQTVTMNVWATGTAPLTYQWYRGSSGVTTNPIAGATSLSYKTPPLTSTSTFWVRVSNGAGSVNSRTVTITVLKKKKG
jgi:hypothetical protein